MGIEANLEQVHRAGRSACELADALRAVRTSWDRATGDGARACGLPVTANAYQAMQDAWFDELGAHIDVLERLCAEIAASAETYRATDEAVAAPFDRGLAGGQ